MRVNIATVTSNPNFKNKRLYYEASIILCLEISSRFILQCRGKDSYIHQTRKWAGCFDQITSFIS